METVPHLPLKSELNSSLHEVVAIGASQDWVEHQIIFNRATDSFFASYSIFANANAASGTSDWVISYNVAPAVKLAPDTLVYRRSKSSLGGLFSSSKDVITTRDVPATMADIQGLFEFFDMLALSTISRHLMPSGPRLVVPGI
jgi:hypothetical protein